MKYITEFRDRKNFEHCLEKMKLLAKDLNDLTLMEVCGTHTMAVARYGIKSLLPVQFHLLSGPGCPVCVTPQGVIDKAIAYSKFKNLIIATFGDMLRVPGSNSNLEKERAEGSLVKVVYSPLEALKLARQNPQKKVVFIGIGFETTAPLIAATILEAEGLNLKNFFVLCAHKLIPPAIEFLLKSDDVKVDGFILPGHVSVIIGSKPYEFIGRDFSRGAVITGFEPLDILKAVYTLAEMKAKSKPKVSIQYTRVVKPQGNQKAKATLKKVFQICDGEWRGIGKIAQSTLAIKEQYSTYDIEKNLPLTMPPSKTNQTCICGEILKGTKQPFQCCAFARECVPERPLGPCMVSSEGTCAAFYRYREAVSR